MMIMTRMIINYSKFTGEFQINKNHMQLSKGLVFRKSELFFLELEPILKIFPEIKPPQIKSSWVGVWVRFVGKIVK